MWDIHPHLRIIKKSHFEFYFQHNDLFTSAGDALTLPLTALDTNSYSSYATAYLLFYLFILISLLKCH